LLQNTIFYSKKKKKSRRKGHPAMLVSCIDCITFSGILNVWYVSKGHLRGVCRATTDIDCSSAAALTVNNEMNRISQFVETFQLATTIPTTGNLCGF